MRSRIVAVLTSVMLLAGTGGVIAASGGVSSGGSAAVAQYKHKCGKHQHRNPQGKCVANKKHHKKHHKTPHKKHCFDGDRKQDLLRFGHGDCDGPHSAAAGADLD